MPTPGQGPERLARITILESGAYVADVGTRDLLNIEARGALIIIDVTAVGAPAGQISSVAVRLRIGSNYFTVASWTGLTIGAVGRFVFLLYPGAATAGGYTAAPVQGILPDQFQVLFGAGNANSITYTAYLVPLL